MYPAKVPELSVDAFHESLICEEETAVAINPVGTDGGAVLALTVSAAALLVTLPAVFVTMTSNVDPLLEAVVAGVVYVEDVAAAMFAPFFCH